MPLRHQVRGRRHLMHCLVSCLLLLLLPGAAAWWCLASQFRVRWLAGCPADRALSPTPPPAAAPLVPPPRLAPAPASPVRPAPSTSSPPSACARQLLLAALLRAPATRRPRLAPRAAIRTRLARSPASSAPSTPTRRCLERQYAVLAVRQALCWARRVSSGRAASRARPSASTRASLPPAVDSSNPCSFSPCLPLAVFSLL